MKFRILPDNIQSVTTIFNSKTTSISPKDFNVDVSKDDNILTLSTCANNNKYRVVLHAKKVKYYC